MSDSLLEGGCQCGEIRYQVRGEPVVAAICHCTKCRRANAAPFVAWAMYKEAQVAFLKSQPKTFASSEQGQRGFCGKCGTQICFTAPFLPGLIDVTIGSLDRPESVAPTLQYWHANHLPWVDGMDQLTRYAEWPPRP